MSDKPKRRWFQFSLKTMLVVITLVCVGPGGYVSYEQSKARRQKAALKAVQKLGGTFGYYYSVPARSAMMRQILGDESIGNVVWVRFDRPQVTDAGLVHLAGLKGLTYLYLDNTQVTDAGLVHLTGLKSLSRLYLDNTRVTDAGVAELQKALPNCKISADRKPSP